MEKSKKKFIKKQTSAGDNPVSAKGQTAVPAAETPKDQEGKGQKEEEMGNTVASQIPTVELGAKLKIEEKADFLKKGLKPEEIPTIDPNAALQIEEETGFMKEDLKQEPESEELNEKTDEQIEKSNTKLYIVGVFLTTLIIAGSIGIFYFEKRLKPQEEKLQVVTEEQKRQPKEEKAAFDRSAWSLEILNGSGVSGAAKKAAGKFAALGYKIVKSGNYDKGSLAITEIYVSESLVGDQSFLLEDVSSLYKSATISGELKDSTASARIIIGKN